MSCRACQRVAARPTLGQDSHQGLRASSLHELQDLQRALNLGKLGISDVSIVGTGDWLVVWLTGGGCCESTSQMAKSSLFSRAKRRYLGDAIDVRVSGSSGSDRLSLRWKMLPVCPSSRISVPLITRDLVNLEVSIEESRKGCQLTSDTKFAGREGLVTSPFLVVRSWCELEATSWQVRICDEPVSDKTRTLMTPARL